MLAKRIVDTGVTLAERLAGTGAMPAERIVDTGAARFRCRSGVALPQRRLPLSWPPSRAGTVIRTT